MFTFPLDCRQLFDERRRQFAAWGIPRAVVARVERLVEDAWRDGPGGWCREWSVEAGRAEAGGRWLLAAHLYGAACFPVANTPGRREALRRQVQCFLRAAGAFPCHFQRLESAELGPLHLYQPRGVDAAPLLCLSGGVDTGKIALHRLAVWLVRLGGFRVLAADMPGTGENPQRLTRDADGYYRQLLQGFGGGGRCGMLGVSFGGYWAAKLALAGDVAAAVDLGGPLIGVEELDAGYAAGLPNGMSGIVAHALGWTEMPPPDEALAMLRRFSLRRQGWLTPGRGAPLLAVNGEADPYVPAWESEVFRAWPQGEVWRFAGLGHCAAERLPWILPALSAWLRTHLIGNSAGNRLALQLARLLLPRQAPPLSLPMAGGSR
ncbi:alpha/beta hydrolase [Chromobacterium violaceum]|uniref:alpha/beta hydrolase n=1 Tax=Chromobacterium violaceum TaxID=536 RepID=UPI0009DA14E6|nr:alpha/beta hydrolase [Chromobacterium violaceum]OQS26177.1 hypothetical protein B0T41_11080 [Chromobacterium violaceum]